MKVDKYPEISASTVAFISFLQFTLDYIDVEFFEIPDLVDPETQTRQNTKRAINPISQQPTHQISPSEMVSINFMQPKVKN